MPYPRKRTAPICWSPDLAYAVGLIASDGNLSGDRRHITLRSNDRDVLETFRGILGKSSTAISSSHSSGFSTKTSYRVQIGDVAFYEWLRGVGLSPRKSLTIGSLCIPDAHFGDFLRGSLDGDGSVITYLDTYNAERWNRPKYAYTRLYLRFLSASKPHIDWIHETVQRLYDLHGRIYRRPSRHQGGCDQWEVKYAKRESLELLSRMFHGPGLPALERKRNIIANFVANAARNVDMRRHGWYRVAIERLRANFEPTTECAETVRASGSRSPESIRLASLAQDKLAMV